MTIFSRISEITHHLSSGSELEIILPFLGHVCQCLGTCLSVTPGERYCHLVPFRDVVKCSTMHRAALHIKEIPKAIVPRLRNLDLEV